MAMAVRAVRIVFAKRGRVTAFAVLAVATFALFIWLPVKLTPGNDFLFQLSIMRWSDFVLFGVLSLLNALLMLMQWHLHKAKQDARASLVTVAASGAGGVSAVFASMLGTASCSACVAGILGFLGSGSVLFLLTYGRIITVVAMTMVVVAIWFAARRVDGICTSCDREKKSC